MLKFCIVDEIISQLEMQFSSINISITRSITNIEYIEMSFLSNIYLICYVLFLIRYLFIYLSK